MKTLMVLKLPQALPDLQLRGVASLWIEDRDDSPIGAASLLHHVERLGTSHGSPIRHLEDL